MGTLHRWAAVGLCWKGGGVGRGGAHLFPLDSACGWSRGWGEGHLTDNGESHLGLATLQRRRREKEGGGGR